MAVAVSQVKSVGPGGRFKIVRRLAGGAFGDVFLGLDTERKEQVAVKMEVVRKSRTPTVMLESKIYSILHSPSEAVGFAFPHYFGVEAGLNVLVMDLLGPSIETLMEYCGGKFSVKTVLMLADQMISRLEHLHSRGLVHRDIKPENFLLGLGPRAGIVHLIDFGLAKVYRKRDTGHLPYADGLPLTGTMRYASINNHLGIVHTRRDDMESLGLLLAHMLRGNLPWAALKEKDDRDKYKKIKQIKLDTDLESLVKGFPAEFASFISHCRNLRFDGEPDYAGMRRMFRELYVRQGWKDDGKFDWSGIAGLPTVDATGAAAIPAARTLSTGSDARSTDSAASASASAAPAPTPAPSSSSPPPQPRASAPSPTPSSSSSLPAAAAPGAEPAGPAQPRDVTAPAPAPAPLPGLPLASAAAVAAAEREVEAAWDTAGPPIAASSSGSGSGGTEGSPPLPPSGKLSVKERLQAKLQAKGKGAGGSSAPLTDDEKRPDEEGEA